MSTDLLDQVQLILAVVLIQTIGLFHQQSDQRASSSIYHGMLVMVGNSIPIALRLLTLCR